MALLLTAVQSHAATISVNSIAGLQSAIDRANPGDRIVVANGTYTTSEYITVTRAGTAENRITIEAETILGVEIGGTHSFLIESAAAYVTVKGFHFTNKIKWGDDGANKINAQFCRFTRNFFNNQGYTIPDPREPDDNSPYIGDMLHVSGYDAEIDHNEFSYLDPQRGLQMIQVIEGRQRVWIHHNYFHDHLGNQGNGRETIKIGNGVIGGSSMNALVEYNLFENCHGEAETISNKASDNTYRYNTFIDCEGFTLRSGDDCKIYGNYFSGGSYIRLYGERHQLFSNYFKGGYLNIGSGDGEAGQYRKPVDCRVAYNTFYQCWSPYRVSGGVEGSDHVTFANNIIYRESSVDDAGAAWVTDSSVYTNPTWEGNILWNIDNVGALPSSGYTVVDPKLAYDADRGVYVLQADSPAIGAAVGAYPEVTVDVDGQVRDGAPDVGVDEYSSAPVVAGKLTTDDVGPSANRVAGMAVIQGSTEIANGGSHDLGEVQQDDLGTVVFTIANHGTETLLLTDSPAVSISGDAEISISSNIPNAAADIVAGGNATFALEVSTAVKGNYSATVQIANNDPDHDPYVFDVTATVVQAGIDIHFLTAEEYATGNLGAHADWGGHGNDFQVNPTNTGTVQLPGGATAWKKAVNQTALTFSQVYRAGIEFAFTRTATHTISKKDVISVEFKETPTTSSDSGRTSMQLQRFDNDSFRLVLVDQSGGGAVFPKSGIFQEGDLGFDTNEVVSASDDLWFGFTITRGSSELLWTGVGVVSNLTEGSEVMTIPVSFTTSSDFFNDGSLYALFGSVNAESDSFTSNRVVDRFRASTGEVWKPILSYEFWASTNGVGGMDEDFDEDGLSNLYEYALKGDPKDDADQGILFSAVSGENFEFVHAALADLQSNVEYIVEVNSSGDLVDGNWTNAGITVTSGALDGDYTSVTNSMTISGDQGFIRLRINEL